MPPPPLCTCGPCIYAHDAPHFVGLVPVYPLNLPLGAFNLQARCVSMSSKNNYNHSRSWKLTFIQCLLFHSQRSKHTTHINSFSASRSLYFRIFSIIIVNFIYVYNVVYIVYAFPITPFFVNNKVKTEIEWVTCPKSYFQFEVGPRLCAQGPYASSQCHFGFLIRPHCVLVTVKPGSTANSSKTKKRTAP